ncbi:MAG: hypothetical protein U9N77_14735 [Thermodesulfobacteriota bacterium]|nr:hypothetical protein [Thermodesulfobacteriota bacterium]
MPTIIEHMQGAELPPFLQERFKVKPQQFLKITVEVEEADEEIDDSEFEIDNLGDSILKGLQEIVEAKKKGVKLPNARELLKEL